MSHVLNCRHIQTPFLRVYLLKIIRQYQETQLTLSLTLSQLSAVVSDLCLRWPHREQHDLYMLFIYYYRYKI